MYQRLFTHIFSENVETAVSENVETAVKPPAETSSVTLASATSSVISTVSSLERYLRRLTSFNIFYLLLLIFTFLV
jgi:hypothetical protein